MFGDWLANSWQPVATREKCVFPYWLASGCWRLMAVTGWTKKDAAPKTSLKLLCLLAIYEYIEYGAGRVPWQPPNSTATLQRWRNGRWTHWPFGSNWWKKEATQHCFAWGMHTVYLHSNVFHHHGISIWMAYILARFLSYIEPLWDFNSVVIMTVASRHLTRPTTLCKPLLLQSP